MVTVRSRGRRRRYDQSAMAASKRSLIAVLLLALVALATSCGTSNDPQTWAEAEADGNLQDNFQRACIEANQEGGELDFDDAQAAAYCECAFIEIVEYFGGEIANGNTITDVADAVSGRDFEAFKEFEAGLRDDPERIPADIEAFLTGCAGQAAP